MEEALDRNMEPLQAPGPGQSVFTGQTPWIRGVNNPGKQSLISEGDVRRGGGRRGPLSDRPAGSGVSDLGRASEGLAIAKPA